MAAIMSTAEAMRRGGMPTSFSSSSSSAPVKPALVEPALVEPAPAEGASAGCARCQARAETKKRARSDTHTDPTKRGRSASPERRGGERSRSRSRERYHDTRRNHSPNGYHEEENRASSYDRNRAPPPERSANREQRMSQGRETSQQDRRVYVGNLPYEVSWQSLKGFMKEGNFTTTTARFSLPSTNSFHSR